jgi:hypothetical protein
VAGKRRRGRTPPPVPTPSSPVQPLAVGRAKTRRELRAERRRQQRKRIGAVGIAGIVVAGLVAAAAIGFGVNKATSTSHDKPVGQTTVLFALAGANRAAVETALLAYDDQTRQGVELLVPDRVLTEVCGFGNQQLGQVLALPDGQRLSRTAVSDLLGGVSIDGSWVLSGAQFAKLVNAVGGITVDIDTNVIRRQAHGGGLLLLSKGPGQKLNGAQAVQYATYVAPGEESVDNLVRLQAVLDGVLAALPHDNGKVSQLVTSLGPTGRSTLGAPRLAAVLTGLAAAARHNDVLPTDLPVVKIDVGAASAAYRVDTEQTASFVDSNLAASVPASAKVKRTRVFVQNGVGTPGLVATACTRLIDAGFAFAGSGNAAHFGYTKSKVLVFDHSVPTARIGNSVARALRLPAGDVAVSDSGQNVADVVVILGKDYKR